jgi:DNA replication and repair protein RecF
VFLTRLTTRNFRNLDPAEWAFHPAINLFVGRNGQGKTNLLEAIYFLATTKSFRTPRVASLYHFGTASLFTGGAISRDQLEQTQSVGIEADTGRRALLFNGQTVGLSDYLSMMPVFAYSVSRLEIIRGEPEARRRFLDRGIAGLRRGYIDELGRYQRVLRQRNALLQAIVTGAPPSGLDAWDEEFVVAARAVTLARQDYTSRLLTQFRTIVSRYSYHVGDLSFEYVSGTVDDPARPADEWRERVRRLRAEEIRMRRTLVGPHRDNLIFSSGGRPAAEVLSGGEAKTIVLFLKFSKIDLFREATGRGPVLLLDDIDSELDPEILESLLSGLPAGSQLFATSAKERYLSTLQGAPHRLFRIEGGRLAATLDL